MIFGIVQYPYPTGDQPAFCLLASKPNEFSKPIPVEQLEASDAGVYFLSNTEGVIVQWDSGEQAKLIHVIAPATIFLTPDTPDRPGIPTQKLKIREVGEKKYEIDFQKKSEDGWQRWNPVSTIR